MDRSFLDTAKSFLLEKVAVVASEIDSNPDALFQALQGLGELGLLALRVPCQWGGKEASEESFGDFQELVARYSGALAFLLTQHESAAGMLVASSNSTLQEKYLPLMGNGEVLLGVGFSQLRRGGEPVMTAIPVDGGYLLDGVVPWVTGYNCFHEFIVAATLSDGGAVFGVVPFSDRLVRQEKIDGKGMNRPVSVVRQERQGRRREEILRSWCDRVLVREERGSITFSLPAELAAMPSTNTVSVSFSDWFLPQECVVFIKPSGWIHENDKKNVLKATFLATGCALAGLDIVEAASLKNLPFITDAFGCLQQELNNCRTAIREGQQNLLGVAEKLQLRAWAIDLATRIAHAAVTVSSGAANYKHHHAQRVYREALVFTVTGQSRDVMEATLQRLTFRTPPQSSPQFVREEEGFSASRKNQIIHLSHVIDIDIPQWEGDPKVDFDTAAELEKDGYYLRRFSMGEHSATHMNAPKSFYLNGVGIDQYPAESLFISAVVIDIRRAALNADYTLTVGDVLAWEKEHGEMAAGCLVLLHTGWQEKWGDRNAFMNRDGAGDMHFPGFGKDVIQFLIDERQIAGVGIDTHGVDSGLDTTFAINRMVLEKPRIVLENLTNLDKLPSKGIMLAIAPLLLRGGSGSPVGVLAFILH